MKVIDWQNFVAWVIYFYRDTIEAPDGVHLVIFFAFMCTLWALVRITNAKAAAAADCSKLVGALQRQNRQQEIALAMLYGLIRANHGDASDFPSIEDVLCGDVSAVRRLVPGYTPTVTAAPGAASATPATVDATG